MSERIAVTLNGRLIDIKARPERTLLDVLRNTLGLTGARYGCGGELCGACTVLLDGVPTYSCTLPLFSAAGRRVETVEGLADAEEMHPLQQAFIAEQAGQCGYCLAGILMSAKALLDREKNPSRAAIVAALERHLCRCGAHNRIIRAVARAAAMAGSVS
jgi:nicotinate dehydrogenase subunit A